MSSTTPIDSKPAAGLLGGALCTVGLGIATRNTGYDPSVEEVAGWTTLAAFACAWLVPSRLWSRWPAEASRVEVDGIPSDPHEPTEAAR